MVNHKVIRLVLAFSIGIVLSVAAFQMFTDPQPVQERARERAREEAAVYAAREIVRSYVDLPGQLNIVDPLAPNRVVGKAYVYPVDDGWQVSGYYRRDTQDSWHPYLLTMNSNLEPAQLSVRDRDASLKQRAATDDILDITP